MKPRILRILRISSCCFLLMLPFGCIYACVDSACISETRMRIQNLAGYDFKAVEVNCDTLAKEAWVDVFVSETNHWGRKLVFQYDGDDPPSIRASGKDNFDIVIPTISELFCQSKQWKNAKLDYHIGFTEFPHSKIQPCR